MDFPCDVISNDEQIIFKLRALYSKHGYAPFRMSRFEQYELYAANKAFLPAGDIVTFTDASGRLMALRPDVTLSIIKNIQDDGELKKLYYNETVYRTVGDELKEHMQVGLECIGRLEASQIGEVLMLAKQSLDTLGAKTRLDMSHMGLFNGLLSSEKLMAPQRAEIANAVRDKNISAVIAICETHKLSKRFCDYTVALAMLHGKFSDIKSELESICITDDMKSAFREIDELDGVLKNFGINDSIGIDFSVVNDITYYNGIVFQGYIEGIPEKVLSGGSYDELIHSFGKSENAIGFAVNLGLASSLKPEEQGSDDNEKKHVLNVALPKGRLGKKAYELFKTADFNCPEIDESSRKLVYEDIESGIRFFWVKPSDVAIYVQRGVADIGVVGKDTLLESEPDVYELLDLDIGRCRICVATAIGTDFDGDERTIRVATKYPNIARQHYKSRGRDIDVIMLNGSVELAPLLGLSDVIVDLVETGKTLAANNMELVEKIMEISARLVANKASYRFNYEKIRYVCDKISAVV